ncbi:type Z 30S ribosomal protein S14 [bacterium]|jgi:small subunit ribosomal protein S14|nr:type Z 30S ribosomal protein S14 [bacterium]
MAKTSMVLKNLKKVDTTQHRNRCNICGRPRGFMRFFGLCRLCFRKMAGSGKLPGVKKASW